MYLVNVNVDLCTACGECVDVCPVDYLALEDGAIQSVGDECQGCESCVEVCAANAISVQEV